MIYCDELADCLNQRKLRIVDEEYSSRPAIIESGKLLVKKYSPGDKKEKIPDHIRQITAK